MATPFPPSANAPIRDQKQSRIWMNLGWATAILSVFAILLTLAVVGRNWEWTGFGTVSKPPGDQLPPKTLWDWLDLLIVPTVIAAATYVFNHAKDRRDKQEAAERHRETVYQWYLKQICDLLLDGRLNNQATKDEVRHVARSLTLTAVKELDRARKRALIQFLAEARLIQRREWKPGGSVTDALPIIELNGADFSGASLVGMNLTHVPLSDVDLTDADLRWSRLTDTDLDKGNPTVDRKWSNVATLLKFPRSLPSCRSLDLRCADLTGADLHGLDLDGTDFRGAILDRVDLLLRA